jgi:hypothetical protein
MSTIEELHQRRSSGSGLKTEIAAVEIRCADHATPIYPQKLALTSPKSDGRSVGIVRLQTKATELYIYIYILRCSNEESEKNHKHPSSYSLAT